MKSRLGKGSKFSFILENKKIEIVNTDELAKINFVRSVPVKMLKEREEQCCN